MNNKIKNEDELRKEYDAFMISTLFMDIEDYIDCCGMTFEEFKEQYNRRVLKNEKI